MCTWTSTYLAVCTSYIQPYHPTNLKITINFPLLAIFWCLLLFFNTYIPVNDGVGVLNDETTDIWISVIRFSEPSIGTTSQYTSDQKP